MKHIGKNQRDMGLHVKKIFKNTKVFFYWFLCFYDPWAPFLGIHGPGFSWVRLGSPWVPPGSYPDGWDREPIHLGRTRVEPKEDQDRARTRTWTQPKMPRTGILGFLEGSNLFLWASIERGWEYSFWWCRFSFKDHSRFDFWILE